MEWFLRVSKNSSKCCKFILKVSVCFLPTAFIQRVAGDEDVVFRRISWIAPLSAIAISTFVSYTFYALLSSSLINGAILGCHSTAMQLFSQASWRDDALGLITLEGAIRSLVWSPNRFSHLSQTRLLMIEFKSDRLASIALFASSIVLTILFKNPILANGIAYPLAAITKIATMFFIDVLKIR